MPPKRKPPARSKASAKSKAPAKKEEPEAVVSASAAPPEESKKRVQANRRDIQDKAARAIEHRLKHLPMASWTHKRNSAGQSIQDVVEAKYEEYRGARKKLSGRFAGKLKTLKTLMRSVVLEYEFLEHHAEPMLSEKVDAEVMSFLPTAEKRVDITAAIANMLRVKTSEQVQALGRAKESEIDGIHDLLMGIKAGRGPDKKDLQEVSSIYKRVVHQIPFFFTKTVECVPVGAAAAIFSGKGWKTLSGMPALRAHRDELAKLFEKDGECSLSMKELMPLKCYGYLFSDAEIAEHKTWIQMMSRRLESESAGLQKAITDVGDKGTASSAVVLAATQMGGSSSSSGGNGSHTASTASPMQTSKAMKKGDKASKASADMLRFFVGKKKPT